MKTDTVGFHCSSWIFCDLVFALFLFILLIFAIYIYIYLSRCSFLLSSKHHHAFPLIRRFRFSVQWTWENWRCCHPIHALKFFCDFVSAFLMFAHDDSRTYLLHWFPVHLRKMLESTLFLSFRYSLLACKIYLGLFSVTSFHGSLITLGDHINFIHVTINPQCYLIVSIHSRISSAPSTTSPSLSTRHHYSEVILWFLSFFAP